MLDLRSSDFSADTDALPPGLASSPSRARQAAAAELTAVAIADASRRAGEGSQAATRLHGAALAPPLPAFGAPHPTRLSLDTVSRYRPVRTRGPGDWFDEPRRLRGRVSEQLAHAPGLPGLQLRFTVRGNRLETDSLSYREVEAQWSDADEVIAQARLGLLQSSRRSLDDTAFFGALAPWSSGSRRLAGVLCSSYGKSLATLFRGGQLAVLHVERLEVREDHCGQALASTLLSALIGALRPRFAVGVVLTQPYPAQFVGAVPGASDPEHCPELEASFQAACARLHAYVRRLPDVVQLKAASTCMAWAAAPGTRIEQGPGGWWLERDPHASTGL